VVTTSRGIGGAWRKISVPTHPKPANENPKNTDKNQPEVFHGNLRSAKGRLDFSKAYTLCRFNRCVFALTN
jgi:hypothetical protein